MSGISLIAASFLNSIIFLYISIGIIGGTVLGCFLSSLFFFYFHQGGYIFASVFPFVC